MKSRLMFVVVVVILSVPIAVFAHTDEYAVQIEQWHKNRIERLKQPDGWLSLAGLYWLQEGDNSFGSDAVNDIRFPENAPAFIGIFTLRDGSVSVAVNNETSVTTNGKPVNTMSLTSDASGEPTILESGSLLWYIIDRDGKMGVRLKDTDSKNVRGFHGIERYPVDVSWRVKAKLDSAGAPPKIKVPSVLGTAAMEPCPGALVFSIAGKEYRLYPIGERDSERYFLIFADLTNGDETYGAGRFLSIDGVDETGETYIDFNKAYNPPCAFTPYATCPLPPRENRLLMRVTAGEKSFGDGH